VQVKFQSSAGEGRGSPGMCSHIYKDERASALVEFNLMSLAVITLNVDMRIVLREGGVSLKHCDRIIAWSALTALNRDAMANTRRWYSFNRCRSFYNCFMASIALTDRFGERPLGIDLLLFSVKEV